MIEPETKYGPSKRPRTKPLVRHILPPDKHRFVGRIYDLSIVAMNFDSYDEMAKHADVKYALEVNYALEGLVRRVESLNLAGGLIWPARLPDSFKEFAVSRYEWLTIAADVFLMRYTSVVDCALIFANWVYECDLESRKCSFDHLKKKNVSPAALSVLEKMLSDQGDLRKERNARFHHGMERGFTQDSQIFEMAARFEQRGRGLMGEDICGRKIDVTRSFKEGLVELQREFNASTKSLIKRLNQFYDILEVEFESRFGPRIQAATHGLNVGSRGKRQGIVEATS
jgi:hypothetical protein